MTYPKPEPKEKRKKQRWRCRSQLKSTKYLHSQGAGGRRQQEADNQDRHHISLMPCACGCDRPVTPAHIIGRSHLNLRHEERNLLPLCIPAHRWYDQTAEGVRLKRRHRKIILSGGWITPTMWRSEAEEAGLKNYLQREGLK